MLHKLKVPGTILLLLLAIGTTVALPASAQFELEQEELTELTVSNNATQIFEIPKTGLKIKCNKLTLGPGESVLVSKTTTEIKVTPVFTECEEALERAVTVSSSKCQYVLHLEKEKTVGSTDFACQSAETIEIKIAGTCTYKIASQAGLNSVSYKNKGASAGREIEVLPAIESLTVTRTTSDFPFICPNGTTKAAYSGNSTWKAGKEGAQFGIWVD